MNMSLDERELPETGSGGGGSGGGIPEGAGNLNQARQDGEEFYQAADDAIARALSGDSEAFLNATQQEGGQ